VVIDGGEGSGKTTMIKFLPEILPAGSFVLTREPGGTPLAEKIRGVIISGEGREASAETQFALNFAQRHDHLKKVIEPALANGVNVISDRFDSSTYAYQVAGQGGRGLKELFWQTRETFLGIAKPDIYIFFDVEPDVGLARVSSRNEEKTPFDERDLNFHRRVRAGFLEFFRNVPHRVIDANRPLEEVKKNFLAVIREALNR